MPSTIKYLLTGVTGGLGAKVLDDMLNKHRVPTSEIVVTSRSANNRERFESQGLAFRELDFDRPDTLALALQDIENFLFVSSSEFNNDKRRTQHQNAVDAAKTAGVCKTWYVSLAFGGFEVNNDVSVQLIHNETEEMLIKSGIDFISLRAGVYADAFPLFLNWYPSLKAIHLPDIQPPVSRGHLGLTSRDELGEGMATLFTKGIDAFPTISPKTDRRIVLLTASNTVTFVDIANTINANRSVSQPIEYLKAKDWVAAAAAEDEGGKSQQWFESRLVWFEEMCRGALGTTDPALKTLIGREPLSGIEVVAALLKNDEDFSWHQNDSRGKSGSR